jgi:hypothetical protein
VLGDRSGHRDEHPCREHVASYRCRIDRQLLAAEITNPCGVNLRCEGGGLVIEFVEELGEGLSLESLKIVRRQVLDLGGGTEERHFTFDAFDSFDSDASEFREFTDDVARIGIALRHEVEHLFVEADLSSNGGGTILVDIEDDVGLDTACRQQECEAEECENVCAHDVPWVRRVKDANAVPGYVSGVDRTLGRDRVGAMSDVPMTVRNTFVAAFPLYVAGVLAERGVEIDATIADGIVIGTGVLDGLLASLEAKPPGLASHSPLELFREALRPVDNALAVAGVGQPPIDAHQLSVLPWDRYALSPGSSQQLGAAAHDAHLRWGITKFQAHAVQPTVGLRCRDEDAPRLLEQLDSLGYRVLRLPASEAVSVGVVDIDDGGVDRIVSGLAGEGAHVVVFGVDPDDTQQIRFKALGAAVVVRKQSVVDDLGAHLPLIA